MLFSDSQVQAVGFFWFNAASKPDLSWFFGLSWSHYSTVSLLLTTVNGCFQPCLLSCVHTRPRLPTTALLVKPESEILPYLSYLFQMFYFPGFCLCFMFFLLVFLQVVETCVKNCGHRFHVQVANRDFIDGVLVKIISPKNNPPTIVQDKVLALIQVSELPSFFVISLFLLTITIFTSVFAGIRAIF